MKKALFIMLTLVVIAGVAFADGVTIGAWGRGLFWVGSGGVDPMTHVQASWGPGGARIGFTVAGNSANVGFQADILVDNGSVACGDVQKIWIKPVDMVKLQMGRVYDDTLRGSTSYGIFNWIRIGGMTGDGAVFARIGETVLTANGGNPGVGFELAITPTEGAYIFAGLGNTFLDTATGNKYNLLTTNGPALTTYAALKMADVLKYGQYGAGYTIAGIGLIRIQYVGESMLIDLGTLLSKTPAIVQAAFKLTAVQNLTVDVGGWIPLDSDVIPMTAGIDLFATYSMGALTVNAKGNLLIPKVGDMGMELGIGGSYTVDATNNIGVEADVNYQDKNWSGAPNGVFALLLGLTKGFSNGVVGIGFECTTGSFATNWGTELLPKSAPDALAWLIPIRMEYWF